MAFRLKIIQVGKFPTSWSLKKLQDFGTPRVACDAWTNFSSHSDENRQSNFRRSQREAKNPFSPVYLSLFSLLHAHQLPFLFQKWPSPLFLTFFISFSFLLLLLFFIFLILFFYFLVLFFLLFHPLDTWLNVSHSHKCTTCHAMCHSTPDTSKNVKFRLSRNSTKFDSITRFCKTNSTVKSVSSSEI